VIDQRFNGTSGFVSNSLQGDTETSGDQLADQRNQQFPHAFLNYKEMGTAATLVKETSGDRDVFVITLQPATGPPSRVFIDAQTYMPIKVSKKLNVPQAGGEVEQTTEYYDYREVDGVKIPFEVRTLSVQNFTLKFTKVAHNVAVDEALFSKPAK
jgi:hypothetical protein